MLNTVSAVDCTGLSPTQISDLDKNGVKFVGRYLSKSSWKGLTLGEVANLKAAGIKIFSIYETDPTKESYFSTAQGKEDAVEVKALAKEIGQPEGSAIYFTVDYDAQSSDLEAILAYFQSVKANLPGFKVGAYGSFTVLNYLHEHKAADYWFQTVAWSNGQTCSFLNIYQFQCNETLSGVNVDFDKVETADIGAWNDQPKQVIQQPSKAATTEAIKIPNYHNDNAYHVIKSGETLSGIALKYHVPMNVLAKYNLIQNPDLIQVGKTLRIPVVYEIRSGDTVTDLARRRNDSTSVIGYVNGLENINKIYIGQTLWV